MKQFNLKKEKYPVTIRLLRSDDRREVWTRVIDLPNEGAIPIHIPGMANSEGVPIIVRVEYADGEIAETGPPNANI
jgi:hypothetical protein